MHQSHSLSVLPSGYKTNTLCSTYLCTTYQRRFLFLLQHCSISTPSPSSPMSPSIISMHFSCLRGFSLVIGNWGVCIRIFPSFIHSPILLYSRKDCATFILHIITYCSVPFRYLSVLTLSAALINLCLTVLQLCPLSLHIITEEQT